MINKEVPFQACPIVSYRLTFDLSSHNRFTGIGDFMWFVGSSVEVVLQCFSSLPSNLPNLFLGVRIDMSMVGDYRRSLLSVFGSA